MRWCSLAALAILMLAIAIPAAARQRHRWWQSTEMKADLGLTDEQSERLEDIYQSTLPDLRNLMQSLNEEEAGLSELIDAMEADEWEITLQIDKVESARSALSKTRILMLYRMHRELSQDQRGTLRRWSDSNGRRPRRSSPTR